MKNKLINWWQGSFLKRILSKVWIQAIIFSIFFPHILMSIFHFIGGFFSQGKQFAVFSMAPGFIFVFLLQETGWDGGMASFFLLTLLFNIILYFLLYLGSHYCITKYLTKKQNK